VKLAREAVGIGEGNTKKKVRCRVGQSHEHNVTVKKKNNPESQPQGTEVKGGALGEKSPVKKKKGFLG